MMNNVARTCWLPILTVLLTTPAHYYSAVAAAVGKETKKATLLDTVVAANEDNGGGLFDILIAAVGAAPDVASALGDEAADLTVMAPNDDAFSALGLDAEAIGALDPYIVSNILLYHTIGKSLYASDVLSMDKLTTLFQDKALSVDTKDITLTDSQGRPAGFVLTDVEASNGVAHVIDSVLLPPSLVDVAVEASSATGDFNTLIAAVTALNLTDALADLSAGALTVLAPTDEAFSALGLNATTAGNLDPFILQNVLLYHVVPGVFCDEMMMGSMDDDKKEDVEPAMAEDMAETYDTLFPASTVQFEGDKVVDAQSNSVNVGECIYASNGAIRVVDSVILPDDIVSAGIGANESTGGAFSTLLSTVIALDLVEALSFPNGPYTVMAPTDDAFQSLIDEFGSSILEDPEVVKQVVLSHVVDGAYRSSDLVDGASLTTLTGAEIMVSGGGFVDESGRNAGIVVADVLSSNGYIHAIDSVLVPQLA